MIKSPKFYLTNEGDFSTIVFLHGWGMNASSFDCVKSNLSNDSQVLTLDFFGFGESENPPEYFDTYEYAYSVFLLLNKLQVKNIVLIGHSFGGRVSIVLSSIFKLNLNKLILTSSAGVNFFSFKKFIKINIYKIIKRISIHIKCFNNLKSKFGSYDYKGLDIDMRKVFVRIVNQDLKYLLKYIRTDTLLFWDKYDNVTPFRIAKVLNKLICQSKIMLKNNGKHYVFMKNNYSFAQLIDACNVQVYDNNI